MKKFVISLTLAVSLTLPSAPVRADMFGGDVAVLLKILAQAVEQYIKLREILTTARSNLALIRDLNSGINAALGILETYYPEANLRVYQDWKSFSQAFKKAQEIYGKVPNSKNATAQRDIDTSVVDSILMYNQINKHSRFLDSLGEKIKVRSQSASPKGAAKLTAETLGVSLQVQNEILRTQAAQLKVQAQDLAYRNKIEKEETDFFLGTSSQLKGKMKSLSPNFKTPRY